MLAMLNAIPLMPRIFVAILCAGPFVFFLLRVPRSSPGWICGIGSGLIGGLSAVSVVVSLANHG